MHLSLAKDFVYASLTYEDKQTPANCALSSAYNLDVSATDLSNCLAPPREAMDTKTTVVDQHGRNFVLIQLIN